MDAKQFAWIYIIENGIAGVKRSYYGGYDYLVDTTKYERANLCAWDGNMITAIRNDSLVHLQTVGVNWDKTRAPESSSYSAFTDTFHNPETRETLVGTLVLNDGTKQDWSADAIEITNVFEMMARVSEGEQNFEKIFGQKSRIEL